MRKQVLTKFLNTGESQKLILAKYLIRFIRKNKSLREAFIWSIRENKYSQSAKYQNAQSFHYGVYKKRKKFACFCFCGKLIFVLASGMILLVKKNYNLI